LYNKLSTTSTQQNENMAAIGSRPIRAHHSSHVHASFLYGTEVCCIRCKKLVQEKSCPRNHVRRSSFLYKSTCTSFLYKFLDCVSSPLLLHIMSLTTSYPPFVCLVLPVSWYQVDTQLISETRLLLETRLILEGLQYTPC